MAEEEIVFGLSGLILSDLTEYYERLYCKNTLKKINRITQEELLMATRPPYYQHGWILLCPLRYPITRLSPGIKAVISFARTQIHKFTKDH